jgi:hypothetical protein
MKSFLSALGGRTRAGLASSIALLALSTIVPADAWSAARPVLTGRVIDAETGKPIPYASVALFREDRPEGAPGSAAGGVVSGEDGSFRMQPAAGFYRAIVTHVAYQTARVEHIEIRESQTTNVEFKLAASEFKMKAVEVAGEQAKSTEVSVVARQKEASVVSDGVSAELIKKTPDANAADVLRRVSGLSVVDDKYVHIRGVTDRYNVATMDGVKVSSTDTDTDKRSFTFDLVPGSLLSSTVVVKTAAPDLPGDFSGGLVQVNTLDFPSNRILKLSFSPTYTEGVSTRELLRSEGSSTDWRATDDGSREIPGDATGDDLARALPNTWGARAKKSSINGSYGISYGDRLSLGRHKFGIISSLNYKQSYGRTEFKQEPTFMGYPVFTFDGTRSSYSVLGAGLLNLAYSPGRGHDFSLRNSLVRNAKDQVSVSEGLPASGEWARRQTISWDERTLYSTQLAGTHELRAFHRLGIDWKLFRSGSDAYEPDRKHVEFERTGDLWALKENYRTWSSLGETTRGASADIRLPFGLSDLKAGVFTETRKRDYEIDAYATDPSYLSSSNYGLLVLPLDSIFLPENYGPGKFRFVPLVRFTGEYDGKEEIRAYYGMIDHPFTLAWMRFNAAGGLRVERSVLAVNTIQAIDDPIPITARDEKTETLPSLNFTYMPTTWGNLRLAYGRSVNRPELREMANVLYYDFEREQNVIGNPDLKHALIENYDLRFEAFPGDDQVLAFSVFHKHLHNAIEEQLLPSPERFVRTWFNSDGNNDGWEAEIRKTLGFIHPRLSNFTLMTNYTQVRSAIAYTEKSTDPQGNRIVREKTRPMQGQAPWTQNLSLLYTSQRSGTSVNLLLNRAGRRLDAVGDTRDTDVYEETRNVVDLSLSQRLSDRLDLKFTAKNVVGADKVLTVGPEKSTFMRDSSDKAYSLSIGVSI